MGFRARTPHFCLVLAATKVWGIPGGNREECLKLRTVLVLLGLVFVIISLSMGYLIWSGVSLRSAPIIKASPLGENAENVGYGVALRLSAELKDAHYVLWGLPSDSEHFAEIRKMIQAEYETLTQGKVQVNWLEPEPNQMPTIEQLAQCEKPCWVLLPQEQAHQLSSNAFIEEKVKPLGRDYITLTLLSFERDTTVPRHCEQQKRLSFECIKPLSIRESGRKVGAEEPPYFFMRKYNVGDYFLFIENQS